MFRKERRRRVGLKKYYSVDIKIIAASGPEFYLIITRLKHVFRNQNRNHYNQHIFVNKK